MQLKNFSILGTLSRSMRVSKGSFSTAPFKKKLGGMVDKPVKKFEA
jgi:hypothetical protein